MVAALGCSPFGGWRCGWSDRLSRLLDRGAHRPLSHLVCAEYTGPCRHLCRGVLLWGLVYALPQQRGRNPLGCRAVVFRRCAIKETAIAIPLTLAVVSWWRLRAWRSPRTRFLREAAWLCAVRVCRWRPGTPITTPKPASSSAIRSSCATTPGYARAATHRWLRSAIASAPDRAHEPVCAGADGPCRAAARSAPRRRGHERARIGQPACASFSCLLVNALLFSVLGGALLTRYLLPMYPLVLARDGFRPLPPGALLWHWLAVLSAAAFLVGLFVNPPYGFAPEDNLAYAHVVRIASGRHRAAHQTLSRRNGTDGVARDRRADQARAGLREAAASRARLTEENQIVFARVTDLVRSVIFAATK